MKRTTLLGLLILTLTLAGCGEAATPTAGNAGAGCIPDATASGTVEVNFYYPVAVGAPITSILQGYADKFNAANPTIKVTPVFAGGYNDALTKIQTTLQGGGAPPEVAALLSSDMQTLIDGD